MATYLITGTSRGIGLELTKQLLELPVTQVGKVFAVTRGPLSGPLQSLISSNPDRAIHIVASVDDSASVQRAASEVKEKLGAQGLDVLVNNAGLLIPNLDGTKAITPEDMARQFDINVIGVQRVTSAFLPLLEAGNQKKVINVYVVTLKQRHNL